MAVDSKSKRVDNIDDEDDEVLEIDPKEKKKKEQLAQKEKREKERQKKREEKDRKKEEKKRQSEDKALHQDELPDNKPAKNDKKKGKGKGGLGKIFFRLFLLLIIAAIVLVVIFNPYNIRDKYIYGVLSSIPIVKNIVPNQTEEMGEEAVTVAESARITELQKTINELQNENRSLQSRNDTLVREAEELQAQATQWGDFKAEKDSFDRDVAMQDPAAYVKYYESISPTNAEQLYQEAAGAVQRVKDFKKYIATFQAMDEGDAAVIMETMLPTDMDLVVTILNNLDSEHAGAILAAMDPTNSAGVARRMAPQTP